MTYIFRTLLIAFMLLSISFTASAALVDNGDDTITQFRSDNSTLMWLKDANLSATETFGVSGITADGRMEWDVAIEWINAMNSVHYLGYSDWRLPETLPVNGLIYDYTWSYDGSTDRGYNINGPGSAYPTGTGSEMSYLFYTELGNLGYADIYGNSPQPGWGLSNTTPFQNIQPNDYYYYWSGTQNYSNPGDIMIFDFYNGQQGSVGQRNVVYAWAVRSVVPEPVSSTLFIVGGVYLAGQRYLRRKNRT